MAIPAWPVSLPSLPLHDGYNKDEQSGVIRDDYGNGFVNVRRRFTATSKYHTMNMLFNKAEFQAFETFFKDEIGMGSLAFTFRNPLDDGGVMRCRWFSEAYDVSFDGDTLEYYVSFTLEELPGTQIVINPVVVVGMGFYPEEFDNLYVLYVNYSDGNKMYKKVQFEDGRGEALNNVSTGVILKHNNDIYYMNNNDGGRIYKKSAFNTSVGIPITNSGVYNFNVDNATGDIYYIGISDNHLYRVQNGTVGDGSVVYDSWMSDIIYDSAENVFFYVDGLSRIIKVTNIETKTEYVFYNADLVHQIKYALSSVYFLRGNDLRICTKEKMAMNPADSGSVLYGEATGFTVTSSGNIIYSNPNNNGLLVYVPY